MTIDKTGKIIIPTWVLFLLMGILLPVITTYTVNKSTLDKQEVKTTNNTELINKLEEKKVDRAEFKIIQDQLIRIEGKLDRNGRIIQDKIQQ